MARKKLLSLSQMAAALMALALFLIPPNSHANDRDATSGFGLDFGYHQARDEAPPTALLHGGVLYGGRFVYERQKGANLHIARINAGYGDIFNRFNLSAFSIVTGLEYRLLREHKSLLALEDGVFRFGGFLRYGSGIQFYPYTDEAHIYWLTATDFGVAVMLETPSSSGGLWLAEAAMPLVSLVSRSPEERLYNNDKLDGGYIIDKINEEPEFRFPNSHFDFEGFLGYRFNIGKKWVETFGYRLNVKYDSEPADAWFLAHAFSFELSYRW